MVIKKKSPVEKPAPSPVEGPQACPVCGSPTMLFTPNARRDPFERPARYEPAWQCTKCGHLEFIGQF